MDAASIALSGLQAQRARINTASNNIVNAQSTNFTPQEAVLTSREGGVDVTIRSSGNTPPPQPVENAGGFIQEPNVNLIDQTINLKAAQAAYEANLAVLRVADELDEALLDTFS